ncbi:type II secretion system secretin GspD [Maridesulfovibrio hydrothermalis]|uniref:General secretion pathway protein D n=1 Tax=Maridesulfovibrio hydrothermalis AM13 = DSM 14728 TaxID=1121451 RepID=L0RCA4_9BACT|nr:type II secretion system secretin GspD [Maridesulfovibrio hydrothermalis]CCO23196.1 General secretion pathway protein D [Maridesulfovibrio hydrothermalis AM13 = DSM 14728]
MLKTLNKILVAMVLTLVVLTSGAMAQPEGGDDVHANLESISLVEFIKFVGRYTGRNIVFNKGSLPGTHVSIYAGQSLSEPELMAVFQEVLGGAGFYAVTRDNVTYVLPLREAQKISPVIKSSPSSGAGEEMITSIFQLNEEMSAERVAAILKPFASRVGQVTAVPMASSVLVRDLQSNVSKMKKLLAIVKKAGGTQETAIIELEKTNAKSVKSKLASFYKKMSAAGKTGTPPIIESIEWANNLLISGSKDQVRTIKQLVSKLDKSNDSFSALKVYRLHNIEATVAGDVLKSLISGGGLPSSAGGKSTDGAGGKSSKLGSSASSSLSSYGDDSDVKVSADASTNTLIVMAPTDQISQIDKFVNQLDQAQDQVYIEALVLETTLDNAKEFGVEWQGGFKMGGSVATLGFTKVKDSNLPAYGANPSAMPGGYSMGVLGDTISYAGKSFPTIGALVNFSKSATDFNLISAPQIMTIDNSEAEIFVGDKIPYKTGDKSSAGGDSIVATYEYKDVGIKLKVKPHINREEGLVRLELYQTYNTVKDAGAATGLPTTSDRVTKTTVLMADGSTMVIGGLIESRQDRGQGAVPYLSDLPLLGWLFKSQTRSGSKKTLMVFLSARIIQTTEQLEALSKAKMDRYRNQRSRFDSFIDKEFNTYKNKDSKKAEDADVSSTMSDS